MSGPTVDALRTRLDERIIARDRAGAVTEALQAVEAGEIDIPTLYREVLTQLMVEVGARWQRGESRVWEEHVASSTVRTIVEALYPTVQKAKADVAPSGRSVLLACPPDEAHDLGLRMLSDLFDLAGWTTYLLGPDTPSVELADAAETLGVDLVLLTSATHFHRVRVRHVLDALHERVPDTRVVVTGPAYDGKCGELRPDEVFSPDEFFGGGA